MNNFNDPSRLVPIPAELSGFFAVLQAQQGAHGHPGGSAAQGLVPQMQMSAPAAVPGISVQWPQGQLQWPQAQSFVQQPQQWIPGPGQGQGPGPQFQAAPQPSAPNLQNMLASAFQAWVQQQQPQLYQPHPQPQPQPPQPAPVPRTQQEAPPSLPVGSMFDDEARLIEALKSCKAKGITPRQALELLQGVNNHTATEWKDYFLDHHDRLHSHLKPSPVVRLSTSGGSSSQDRRLSKSTAERPIHALPPRQPSSESLSPRLQFLHDDEPCGAPEVRKIPRSQDRRPHPLPSARREEDDASKKTGPPKTPPPAAAGSRRTRGEPVADFHAGTRIPFSEGRMRPAPPLAEDAGAGGRFTPADHRFFIHYLRWRLAKDPLIGREAIYEELAEQTPSHDADAWKRHWDNYPQLPDRIVIEAGKRTLGGNQPAASASRSSALAQRDADNTLDGSEPSGGEEGDESDQHPEDSVLTPAHASHVWRKKTRVTEDDLQAMARYTLEKLDAGEWDLSISRRTRWAEFAGQPQNKAKRTLGGWCSIETTHKEKLRTRLRRLQAGRPLAAIPEPHLPDLPAEPEEPSNDHSGREAKSPPQLLTVTLGKVEDVPVSLTGAKNSPPVHDTSAYSQGDRTLKRNADALNLKGRSPDRKRLKEDTPPEVIIVSD